MILETTSSGRILIADDDPVARTMLQGLLTKWGYQVIAVSDGLEAARVLESTDAPQLAILDWMMPGAEGPEICLRVRALPERPYVYILLVTGRSQRGDLLRGLESGADDSSPTSLPSNQTDQHGGCPQWVGNQRSEARDGRDRCDKRQTGDERRYRKSTAALWLRTAVISVILGRARIEVLPVRRRVFRSRVFGLVEQRLASTLVALTRSVKAPHACSLNG